MSDRGHYRILLRLNPWLESEADADAHPSTAKIALHIAWCHKGNPGSPDAGRVPVPSSHMNFSVSGSSSAASKVVEIRLLTRPAADGDRSYEAETIHRSRPPFDLRADALGMMAPESTRYTSRSSSRILFFTLTSATARCVRNQKNNN